MEGMNERSNPGTPGTVAVEDGRISEAVLHAVGQATDIDPIEMDTPLYDVIDPDALDRLFRPSATSERDTESEVSFTMEGCKVTIIDNRVVDATPYPAEEP
ncbi:HalOD1 output domain-containing protein [Haladaptatus sp. NG-SE-30]